jgi:hypothetical protein
MINGSLTPMRITCPGCGTRGAFAVCPVCKRKFPLPSSFAPIGDGPRPAGILSAGLLFFPIRKRPHLRLVYPAPAIAPVIFFPRQSPS